MIAPVRWYVVTMALGAAASCARSPTDTELRAQFDAAERLCLEGEFAEAKPLLKQYLIHRPADAGAHYYLGRVYVLSEDFRPAMAEGEFQTALRLFIAQGRVTPIERFEPGYFELICNLDSAKVLFVQCTTILRLGESQAVVRPILERALEHVERAKAVMPNAVEVEQVGGPIRELAARLGV